MLVTSVAPYNFIKRHVDALRAWPISFMRMETCR